MYVVVASCPVPDTVTFDAVTVSGDAVEALGPKLTGSARTAL
jgi:hypothetical protein